MKHFTLLLALTGLMGSAHAADHDLSVSIGTFGNGDELYDLFNSSDLMTSWGLRGGYAFHDRLALIGTFNSHRRGTTVIEASGDDLSSSQMVAAYFSNTIGLGVKADIQPRKWLQLYTSAQGLLYMGQMKLDTDPDSRTNIGQIKGFGLSVGGQLLGGLEIQVGKKKSPLAFAWYVESGAGIVARHGYALQDVNADVDGFDSEADNATMQPGGFVLNSGIGVRF